jgi:hypothetical protein
MRRVIAGIVSSFAAVLGCSGRDQPVAENIDPKFQEITALPVGLVVTHSPNPVKARRGGLSGTAYTWVFETSVTSVEEPVTVTEFGGFGWFEGRWVFANFTGIPFTAEEFADWYSCPGAKVTPGRSFTDPTNWSGDATLRSGKALWYFVGVTSDGRRVKGEAVIEKLGTLEE